MYKPDSYNNMEDIFQQNRIREKLLENDTNTREDKSKISFFRKFINTVHDTYADIYNA